MIKFEKVPFKQFKTDWVKCFGKLKETTLKKVYEDLKLPRRATEGSAGYDFFLPLDISFIAEDNVLIPTGIRFVTDETDKVLLMLPRSGLGFKYGERLINTVGIIDQDYQFADNCGHIMVKISCENNFNLKAGDAFCQGVITQYYITVDDSENVKDKRTGGFGSTSKSKG